VRAGPTPAAQDAYAWALMANGRAADARDWSDKATFRGRANALFAFHRGMIESSLGRDGAGATTSPPHCAPTPGSAPASPRSRA
jgi:hypothetical protein